MAKLQLYQRRDHATAQVASKDSFSLTFLPDGSILPGRQMNAVYEGTSKMQLVRRLSLDSQHARRSERRERREEGLPSSATISRISPTKRRKVYRGGDRINADSDRVAKASAKKGST